MLILGTIWTGNIGNFVTKHNETLTCNVYTHMKHLYVRALLQIENILRSHAVISLPWRHNERNGISNLRPHDCLSNRLFRRKSKKTSKLRVTGFCEGNSPVTGEFPAQRPVTWKMFQFEDSIMIWRKCTSILIYTEAEHYSWVWWKIILGTRNEKFWLMWSVPFQFTH